MRTLLAALALAPAALGLAACGGDDDGGGGSGGGGGPPVTFDAGQTVAVKGVEYAFEPGNVVVQGAGETTLSLENAGSLAHNLRLTRDGEDVGGTTTFQGGETKTAKVDLQPGTYEMICTVGDHARLGMVGKLTVR